MKRVVLTLVLCFAVLTAISAGGAAWMLTTERGTAWLLERVQAGAAPSFSVGAVRGSLWHGVVLTDLTVRTRAGEARVDRTALLWNPRAILTGTLVLEHLSISRLSYRPAGQTTEGAGGGFAGFPLRVLIRRGLVESFLYEADDAVEAGPIEFSAGLDGERLTVEELTASGFGAQLWAAGTLRIAENPEISTEVRWSAAVGEGMSVEGRGSIEGFLPVLQIRQELLVPFQATVEGRVDVGESPSADVSVEWTDLDWPGVEGLRSAAGAMRLDGWLEAFDFSGEGVVNITGTDAQFSGAGSATPAVLSLEVLTLSGDFGELSVSGEVEIDPLAWQLQVRGRDLDPGFRFEAWPGALAVNGTLSGRLAPGLEWRLDNAELEGMVRGRAVAANGGIGFQAPGTWMLDAVSADIDASTVAVHGRIDETLALDAVVDVDDLGLWLPGAAGRLSARGQITGPVRAPGFSGSVDGRSLALGGYSAGSLELRGQAALADKTPLSVELRGEDLQWGDLTLETVTGTAKGEIAAHVIYVEAMSEFGTGRFSGTGGWSENLWQGQMTALSLEQPMVGAWELSGPAALELGRGVVRLERGCLRRGGASLCAAVRIGTADEALELALDDFDLSAFNLFLGEGLSVDGLYDASLELEGPLGAPTGRLTVVGGETRLEVIEDEALPVRLALEQARLDAVIHGQSLEITGALSSPAGARFTLDAAVTDPWSADPALDGRLNGSWTELQVLSLISPDVGDVGGVITLDVGIAGSVREPRLEGEARWMDGSLSVPQWGLVVDRIQAAASSDDARALTFEASGQVGESGIRVDGSMDLDPGAGWPMRLAVRGDALQAVRLPDAEVFVSPELEVEARTLPPTMNVTGTVAIPRARVLLDEVPAQAAVPSTDTVVHGGEGRTRRRPLSMHADVDVVLGEDVTYSGAGLDVSLTGEMRLVYDSGRAAVATGAVGLDGEYRAYGQTLDIDRGQLLFTGPLDNPGLDVRAVRRVEETTVGVQLGGTVRAPTTRIFSQPAMAEADALAFLLLGRPLSGSGDQETATLESAAVSMGLQQALPAIQRVGETLGFDELSVQSTASDAGELMAGKQLTQRLYIRYSYGLFNRIGGLLMRFRLNDRLSLETRSGDYESMDLIYTVEKD